MRPLILLALPLCVISCDQDYQPGAGGPDMSNPVDMTASTDNNHSTNNNQNPPGDPSNLGVSDPTAPMPALSPQLVALTYVGGEGDQYIRKISFEDNGDVRAEGEGFVVVLSPSGALVREEGDRATDDGADYGGRPALPGDPGALYTDPRVGLSFRVGYRQAGRNLQTPIFRAFMGEERVWALWGHAGAEIEAASLGADSRCYQAWGMPGGKIGVQCWTDGGSSVLVKGPRDLTTPGFDPAWAADSYQRSAGGMSSMYAVVDPREGGSVVSGTFMARHVSPLVTDAWGRVYIASTASRRNADPEIMNPFEQDPDDDAGVSALDPTLREVILNARLGGRCEGGSQRFGAIALRGNLLVLGGTTCADDVRVVNAAQAISGGGQDGLVAIIRLW
jgi:hypothetical protein